MSVIGGSAVQVAMSTKWFSVVTPWSLHVCSLVPVKVAMLFGLQWQLEVGYVALIPSATHRGIF